MELQRLIKEIHHLADRIKSNASADSDSLLTDAARLYEMVVLLKHLPGEVKTEGQNILVISESIPVQKEETKVQSGRTPSEEKQQELPDGSQVAMDLFSSELNPPHEKIVREESPKESDATFGETPASARIPKRETVKASPSKKKADESVAEKLQRNKITELKSAIGINEKFQFINELFDGNMKEYTVAIDQLNSFHSFAEAESYLANLQKVYKWNPDNLIVSTFEELIQRRFF